jgi:hypothetical protein
LFASFRSTGQGGEENGDGGGPHSHRVFALIHRALDKAVVVTRCRPGDDPHTVATTSCRATTDFEIRVQQ